MISGVPQSVMIWGPGFGDGNDGYGTVEFSAPSPVDDPITGGGWKDGYINIATLIVFQSPGVYTVTVWRDGSDKRQWGPSWLIPSCCRTSRAFRHPPRPLGRRTSGSL
jgi:hypothetical protein